VNNEKKTTDSVAIYWDFENLHAALLEARYGDGAYSNPANRFKPQEPVIDIQAIVELCSSFGPIAINRAYGNWQWLGRYKDPLLQSAVELIQLFPPGQSAKNGADIKLCLDAAEDISRFDHIGTVVIVGGDSDFMPVAQKVKASGRTLIGIGAKKSTNRHWAKSCHEFRYYEAFAEQSAPEPQAKPGESKAQPQPKVSPAVDLLRRAVKLLAETKGEPWVNKAVVWPMIKRLDPTFDTKDHGYANFTEMLKALDAVVEVQKGESDHQIRLK